jgi:hypothetical protein
VEKKYINLKRNKIMEKTSIEWLAEQLLTKYRLKIDNYQEFKQAKEMENQQQEEIGLMEIELKHTKTLLASCEKALEDRNKQDKKMYSEEEVIELIQFLSMNEEFSDYSSVSKNTAKFFIEQFKKK